MFYKVKPWQVVKAVYDMCRPVGMGLLQFTPEPMTEADAKAYVASFAEDRCPASVHMDYVGGRQCKFSFGFNEEGCNIIDAAWYDHTEGELLDLHATLVEIEALNES